MSESHKSKSKDMVLKDYFGKSGSHPCEKYLSKRSKVSDIECTQVSKVQVKVVKMSEGLWDMGVCMHVHGYAIKVK